MIVESFIRIFVDEDGMDKAISFYEALLGSRVGMRFDYAEAGLELAAVSSPSLSVLIIAGSEENRAPFEATRLTVKVEKLETAIARVLEGGAEQLEAVQKTPVGRKTRFRHPDGTVVEYVDHDAPSHR